MIWDSFVPAGFCLTFLRERIMSEKQFDADFWEYEKVGKMSFDEFYGIYQDLVVGSGHSGAMVLVLLLSRCRMYAADMIDICDGGYIDEKCWVRSMKRGVKMLDGFLSCLNVMRPVSDSDIREAGKLFCNLENVMRRIKNAYGSWL
jgi:hypothetical protein